MKILCGCPLSSYKDYVIAEWLQSLRRLKTQGVEIDFLFVDNSRNKTYVRRIKRFCKQYRVHARIKHVTPMVKTLRGVICESRNVIRKAVLEGKYDAFLSLECDVFPNPGDLAKLIAHFENGNPVVAGTYFVDHHENSKLVIQQPIGVDHKRELLCMSQSEGFSFLDGTLKSCVNPGLGFTLIHPAVLRLFSFRADPAKTKVFDDTFFFFDLHQGRIPVKVDTTIFCEHKNSSWNKINKHYERSSKV